MSDSPITPPAKKRDRIRVGLFYHNAGMRVSVEKGMVRIAMTEHDVVLGQQAYWFPSVEAFNRDRRDIFETNAGFLRPVPVFREVNVDLEEMREALAAVDRDPESQEHLAHIWGKRLDALVKERLAAYKKELLALADEFASGHDAAMEEKELPGDASDAFKAGYCSFVPKAPPAPEPEPPPVVEEAPPPPDLVPPAPTTPPDTSDALPPVVSTDKQPEQPPQLATGVPADALKAVQDKVFAAHSVYVDAGKNIRLNEFAEDLDVPPEELRKLIQSDPRFAPIPSAGWVKRAEAPTT